MEQQDRSLKYYLELLWRGKWLIALSTLVALGGAMAFSKEQPPLIPSYRATATIMVDRREVLVGANSFLSAPGGDRNLNTQIQLMSSRNVMERALAKLEPTLKDQIASVSAAQVEALRSAVTVTPVAKTNLLEVTARGPTPELAQRRVEAVAGGLGDPGHLAKR